MLHRAAYKALLLIKCRGRIYYVYKMKKNAYHPLNDKKELNTKFNCLLIQDVTADLEISIFQHIFILPYILKLIKTLILN